MDHPQPPAGQRRQPPPWTGGPYPGHAHPPPGYGYPPPAPAPPAVTGRTTYPRALGAAAVWAGINMLIPFLLLGLPASGYTLGLVIGGTLVPVLVASLATWLIARRRTWPFWKLVLLALPFYAVLRLVTALAALRG